MLRSRRLALLASLLMLALVLPAWADLQDEVARAINQSGLRGATIAISIRDPDTDRTLVRVNDRQPMIPASNMKLLTTGAALHVLGPDFAFETRIVLQGDRLIVIGDGDPGLGDPELLPMVAAGDKQGVTIEEFLQLLVAPIAERITGPISELIVDDRVFDRAFFHPGWPRDQLQFRYCAQVAGLNFHLNILHFFPVPQRDQKPDVSRFEPHAPWLDLTSNRATSNPDPKIGNTFGVARPIDANRFTFLGNVKEPAREPVRVTLHDAPDFFARLLADRLNKRGVRVAAARAASDADAFDPDRQTIVAPLVRTPIGTAITRCNRESYNLYAECLLKRAGHAVTNGNQPGSWANGAAAVRLAAQQRLTDPTLLDDLIVSDGSGLSRDNRVSAALLTAWLGSFHRDPQRGGPFIDSLAVGGVSGTLENRFKDAQFSGFTIHAKSGFINEVSCLSGYVTAADGRRLCFSVLVNDIRAGGVAAARTLQEAVVAAIARELAAAAKVEIGG
ncbi:MAG: D-alanyl-D-alanine carboxypeptidase/D-alanyl-D-alanine-endopeptidase [Phycisphaeraceae bacterium]|nr:MAG: D-alanyl-D-alanine carboxypeptidase/D-alanyl-D-alanine-endopeptidase [Phycisphaeraceae bacterium]